MSREYKSRKKTNSETKSQKLILKLECFLYIQKNSPKSIKETQAPSTMPDARYIAPTDDKATKKNSPDYFPPMEYVSMIASRLARYKTASAKTILMFEKDEHFAATLIKEGFSLENSFKVTVASDSSRSLEKIQLLKPELLIIEPDMLPVDGWSIINMLKNHKQLKRIPIILMSARYNKPSDIIVGLEEFGADDYLVKPFPARILVARAKAVLRRAGSSQLTAKSETTENACQLFEDDQDAIISNGVAISPLYHKVVARDKNIQLTPTEFSVLYFLMKHRDRVVSRDEIIYAVYDSADDIFSRAVDRHICEIRRKLCEHGSIIKTVFGGGYMFSSAASQRNKK